MEAASHWLGVGDYEVRQADHHCVCVAHTENCSNGDQAAFVNRKSMVLSHQPVSRCSRLG